MRIKLLITGYLSAIILANLILAYTGSVIAMYVNGALFIGLNITAKDFLQQYWQGKRLVINMALLILSGSVLSVMMVFLLPQVTELNIYRIAIASFLAFAVNEVGDTWRYQQLIDRPFLIRVNQSNIVSAGLDSILFPLLAFGWPLLWWIVAGQFLAKVGGGFVWSMILKERIK